MFRKPSIFKTDLYICARKYRVTDKRNRTILPKLTISFLTEDGYFAAVRPHDLYKEALHKLEGKRLFELPYEKEPVFPAGQIEQITKFGIYGRISKDCILRAREDDQKIFRARSERWITKDSASLWSYENHPLQQIDRGLILQAPHKHRFLLELNRRKYTMPENGIVLQGMNIIGVVEKPAKDECTQYACLSAEILLRELYQFREEIQQALAEGRLKEEPDPEFVIHNGILEKYLGDGSAAVIPEGVHTIGERAFEYSNVQSVIFPNGLKKIAFFAFNACIYLREVSFPDGLAEIGNSAFSLCRSLKKLVLPASIKKIGRSAFSLCENLQEVSLPDGLKVIEEDLFQGCPNIRSLTIPASVTQINSYAFESCKRLSFVSVSLKTKIGINPFWGTPWLKKHLRRHGALIMGGTLVSVYDKLTEFKIPASVRRIGSFAFLESNIEKLYIPNHVKTIDSYAFSGSHMKSIRLPQALTQIGEHAFSDCLELEELTFPQSVTHIGSGALYNLPNCIVTILNGEESDIDIYPSSFSWYGQKACIKEVRAPYGSKALRCAMLWNLPYTALPGEPKNFTYIQDVFCCCGTVLLEYLGHEKIVHIPDGITEIADYAFAEGYGGCKEIYLPDSVTSIGVQAFLRCSNLRRIAGNGVNTIEASAFFGAEKLEHVSFPNLKTYAKDAFQNCPSLKTENLEIPISAVRN